MRKAVWRLAIITVLGASAGGRSEAMPVAAPAAIAAGTAALVEKAQFIHHGRPYCWYPYGWAGPGWYWCGYGTRTGFGWGGVYGWNGWVVPRSDRGARIAPGHRFRRVQ
jgi:hypothetical protein